MTIRIPRADDPAEVERFIRGLPFRFGSGDEWLKVGPLKIVADGGILIGTSFMREPYGLGRAPALRRGRPARIADSSRSPRSRSRPRSPSAIGSVGRWLRT